MCVQTTGEACANEREKEEQIQRETESTEIFVQEERRTKTKEEETKTSEQDEQTQQEKKEKKEEKTKEKREKKDDKKEKGDDQSHSSNNDKHRNNSGGSNGSSNNDCSNVDWTAVVAAKGMVDHGVGDTQRDKAIGRLYI